MDYVWIFIIGLTIGSFLNVCIYRLPLNQSIVRPGSYCPQCKNELRAIDLIPVLSWLKLRGRCHYCGVKIPIRYAMVELLTGILYLYMFIKVGWSIELLRACSFIAFLIVITLIDYDHQVIFDNVLLYGAGASIMINIIRATYLNQAIYWPNLLLGAFVGAGLLFLIIFISRGRMGEGDALFAGVLGLWFGWQYILITLYIAFLSGGIIAVILLLMKKYKGKDAVPFGSILAIAAFFVYIQFKA